VGRLLLLVSLLALGGCHLIYPFNVADPGPGGDAAGVDGGVRDAVLDGSDDSSDDGSDDGSPKDDDALKDAPVNEGPPGDQALPADKALPVDKSSLDVKQPLDQGPADKGKPVDAPQSLEAAPPPCGSWNAIAGPSSTAIPYFNAVWCNASNLFVAGNAGKAYRLTNSTWTDLSPPNVNIEALWGSGSTNLYAVGGDTILHYNGGVWTPKQPVKGISLYGLWGSGPNDIYAVGSSGTILRFDGGNWKKKLIPSVHSATTFQGVWGSGAKNVFAVGNKGTILSFDGANWTTATTSASATVIFKDVWGSGATNVFAVGKAGTIYHFNGGSWMAQVGPSVPLDAVWGAPGGCVYAAGNFGKIWSRNSVSGWKAMNSTTSYGLMDIHTCAAGTYVVGSLNTVLRLQP
jgi:hypothetical protein